MSKQKKIKLTKKDKQKLKKYWQDLKDWEDIFYDAIYFIEKDMQKEIGIEDLEFFWCDGWVGIGNTSRTLDLIQSDELEE